MATILAKGARVRLAGSAGRLGRWVALHLQERRRKRAGTGTVLPAVPAAPTDLVAEDHAGAQVGLSWSDLAGDQQGFRVYRRVDGDGYGVWQTLDASRQIGFHEKHDGIAGHLRKRYGGGRVMTAEPENPFERKQHMLITGFKGENAFNSLL